MRKVVVQSPRNSTCETAPLSALDFSNWVEYVDGLMVKAERDNKYHLVSQKHPAGVALAIRIGMRNGTLVWVIE